MTDADLSLSMELRARNTGSGVSVSVYPRFLDVGGITFGYDAAGDMSRLSIVIHSEDLPIEYDAEKKSWMSNIGKLIDLYSYYGTSLFIPDYDNPDMQGKKLFDNEQDWILGKEDAGENGWNETIFEDAVLDMCRTTGVIFNNAEAFINKRIPDEEMLAFTRCLVKKSLGFLPDNYPLLGQENQLRALMKAVEDGTMLQLTDYYQKLASGNNLVITGSIGNDGVTQLSYSDSNSYKYEEIHQQEVPLNQKYQVGEHRVVLAREGDNLTAEIQDIRYPGKILRVTSDYKINVQEIRELLFTNDETEWEKTLDMVNIQIATEGETGVYSL